MGPIRLFRLFLNGNISSADDVADNSNFIRNFSRFFFGNQ